jgi:anti-sigma factor RsiW
MTDTPVEMPPADMHCDEFVELVTAYLDGALDDADRERMVAHLSLCDGCSRYLEQFRATIDTLADLPASPVDTEVRQAIVAAFRSRTQKPPGSA